MTNYDSNAPPGCRSGHQWSTDDDGRCIRCGIRRVGAEHDRPDVDPDGAPPTEDRCRDGHQWFIDGDYEYCTRCGTDRSGDRSDLRVMRLPAHPCFGIGHEWVNGKCSRCGITSGGGDVCAQRGHEWYVLTDGPQRINQHCRRCGLTTAFSPEIWQISHNVRIVLAKADEVELHRLVDEGMRWHVTRFDKLEADRLAGALHEAIQRMIEPVVPF